jgi:hypothetical protein
MVAWIVIPRIAIDVIDFIRWYNFRLFHVKHTQRMLEQMRSTNRGPRCVVRVAFTALTANFRKVCFALLLGAMPERAMDWRRFRHVSSKTQALTMRHSGRMGRITGAGAC